VSPEIVSILVLVVIFIIATTLPVNMGIFAFAAAFLVGSLVAGLTADDIFGVFPGDLFIVLVGVTYLRAGHK
jgi:Dicarboxylate carrier protein MatC N-terminus